MDEEVLQKKYMEYQVITEKIKELQEKLQASEQQMMQIIATIQSIDEFSTLQDGCEILVPLNNGIFTRAKFIKDDKLLLNVGASVVVDKSPEDAKVLIGEQAKKLERIRARLGERINKLIERASSLETELNSLLAD